MKRVTRLFPLQLDSIASLRHMLGDDSQPGHSQKILSIQTFKPDSFTIRERFQNPMFLHNYERDGYEFVRSLVVGELTKAQEERMVVVSDECLVQDFVTEQLLLFLNTEMNGIILSTIIYSQEFPDVVRRVLSFCLFGRQSMELHLHKRFNRTGLRNAMSILQRHLCKQRNQLKDLLLFSIASGVVGTDLKGSKTAASTFASKGIELAGMARHSTDYIADNVFEQLKSMTSKGLAVDHWGIFEDEVLSGPFTLVWFSDDFIETIFDLYLIYNLLMQNPLLKIILIPRHGQHGNDASYKDVISILRQPFMSILVPLTQSGRLTVCDRGPRMGAVNLRKLCPAVVDHIFRSDAVYLKGCRAHEMVQGGINRVAYTSFIVSREYSESETGLDARTNPLLFVRSEPNEYLFWGFKGRAFRRETFPDGKVILTCLSTLKEHEERKGINNSDAILLEKNSLISLAARAGSEYTYPCACEIETLDRKLAVSHQH